MAGLDKQNPAMVGEALCLQLAVAVAAASQTGTPGSAVCRAWLETGFGTTSAARPPVSAVVQVDTGKEFRSCGLHVPTHGLHFRREKAREQWISHAPC